MNFDEIARFTVPTNIVFGYNSSREVGPEAKRLGITKAFFITDPGVHAAGILETALASLEAAGIPSVLYPEAPQDPTAGFIDDAAQRYRREGCDGVLVAGGGSALVAGKGTALMATNPGSIRDYAGPNKYPNPPAPCIAITTTAGSGSDVSKNTPLTDEITQRKFTVIGTDLAPKVAILDPLLLRTVPHSQAVSSAIDAFSHAVEGYTTRMATPLTDSLALHAMEIMADNMLPSILTDDLESKAQMLMASTMANLSCGNAGLGLIHAMNQGVMFLMKERDYTPVPYGLVHSIVFPHVLEFNLPAREAKFADMALAMGASEEGLTQRDLAETFVEQVKDLLVTMEAPQRLPWEGVTPGEIEQMARVTLESNPMKGNPRKASHQEVVRLFELSLEGWEHYA